VTISPKAARSLAKRLRLPRSVSDDGKALGERDIALAAKIVALQAEIARLARPLGSNRRPLILSLPEKA
jgi:hypothetical protein